MAKLGTVTQFWHLENRDEEFEASKNYIARTCL